MSTWYIAYGVHLCNQILIVKKDIQLEMGYLDLGPSGHGPIGIRDPGPRLGDPDLGVQVLGSGSFGTRARVLGPAALDPEIRPCQL